MRGPTRRALTQGQALHKIPRVISYAEIVLQ